MCDRCSDIGYICDECFEKLIDDFSDGYNNHEVYEFWDKVFPKIWWANNMRIRNLIDGVGSLIGSFLPLKKKRIKIMSDEEALEYNAKKIQEDWKKVVR